MADAPPIALDEETLERRAQAIVTAIAGQWWIPPLSKAEGSELALWVLARALAPFFPVVPTFNWVYNSGTVGGYTFPNYTTYQPGPGQGLEDLQEVRLILDPGEHRYEREGINRPGITIGIHCTEAPQRAEVYVEVEDLAPQDVESPLTGWKLRLFNYVSGMLGVTADVEGDNGPARVVVDRTVVEVGSPLGCTLYRQPVPLRTRPFPVTAPMRTSGSTINAAYRMGEFLARQLADHYKLLAA